MPKPMEICLEELDQGPEDECFVRCVALPGGDPGLALDRGGAVQWMPESPEAYGLWVSADDRLVLLRGEGTLPIVVERGNRVVEAPVGKPVILLDQDLLLLDGRRLRVHVHGETEEVYAPERLTRSAIGRLARAAAAAATLALGVSAGAAGAAGADGTGAANRLGEPTPIEVRHRPPAPMPKRHPMECRIDKQQASAKGPLVIHATCPTPNKVWAGSYGNLLDPKTGQYLKDGQVKVKTVTGKQIVVEAPQLRKRTSAKQIRFMVRF